MKIPKSIILIVVLFCCFSCGGGSSDSDNSDTTPPASDTPELPILELIGSLFKTTDSTGDIILFGEVKNTGGTGTFIDAKCQFYDEQSHLIGEKSSYIVGTTVRHTSINDNESAALLNGETGAFKIWTSLQDSEVSTYSCNFTYDVYDVTTPEANLEIVDLITEKQSSYSEDLELLGIIKNTGNTGLTFGKIYFIIKDNNGVILDIDSTYISGETVLLSIGTTTDTALSPGNTGTYSIVTDALFLEYSSFYEKYDWRDHDIQDGVASSIMATSNQMSKKEVYNMRNNKIDLLRESVISSDEKNGIMQ